MTDFINQSLQKIITELFYVLGFLACISKPKIINVALDHPLLEYLSEANLSEMLFRSTCSDNQAHCHFLEIWMSKAKKVKNFFVNMIIKIAKNN